MLNVHWPFLLHLEVLVHSVEASFSHHKDASVSLETAVEFLNYCRIEGALLAVQGGQGAHLEWKWGWTIHKTYEAYRHTHHTYKYTDQ